MPLKLNGMTPKGGTALEIGKLTVLVGPNNSGKSQHPRLHGLRFHATLDDSGQP
jgi:predicted ATPase